MLKYFYMLFFCTFSALYSQEKTDSIDAMYFESEKDRLNVKFEIDNDIESFEFNDGWTSYNIEPNSSLRTSISANTRFLTLKVGFSPHFLAPKDADKKGKTKVFKSKLDIFMKNWMQTFDFSSVKGYYMSELKTIDKSIPIIDSEYFILPELKTLRIRGVTRYKFNNNLSYKAVFNQNDIQRKSAGSFIPALTYQYLEFNDPTNAQALTSFDILLNTGYFYTFVINRKWYANLGISPGFGIEFNKLTTEIQNNKTTDKSNDIVFNINTLIGLGYNSKKFFSGIHLRGIATTRNEDSFVQFNTVRGIFQLFIGYRFNTPKFVDRSFDWLEDQNPLK